MFQICIMFLIILSFLSDWGFIYRGNIRPMISFPEIGVGLLIIICFFYKISQENLKVKKNGIKIFFVIVSIILIATLGASLHYNQIVWAEHVKSSLKLLFWGIFIFCWIDILEDISTNFEMSNRAYKLYINFALLISGIAIFQYTFYKFTGLHLKLNPFIDQGWSAIRGNYRAMAIHGEPSWLGVILLPPLISQGELFLHFKKFSYLSKFLFLLAGVVVSFSLASFIVLGIWGGFVLLKLFINNCSIFLLPKIKKKKIQTVFVAFCLIIIGGLIFLWWIYPLIIPRISSEMNFMITNLKGGRQVLTSGTKRFASYEGFWAVLKSSPIFGVGFDQVKYISSLTGKYFEATTSGIFGFIGTSAGILGLFLFFYILKFIWNGNNSKKEKIKSDHQSELIVAGRAMVLALFLEQLFLYAGILNSDFWLPLAFGYLFIRSGYKELDNTKILN